MQGGVSEVKKGSWILLSICVCSLCLVLGLFIGRNMQGHYVMLPANATDTDLADDTAPVDFRIDINTATESQLLDLPGIGEITARRIIDYRTEHGNFTSVEDLLLVEGIGEKKLQEIETLVKVGG